MNKFAVIMAGGGGTRFWPLSRQVMPKQLLNLSGNDAMINETIDRISTVVDKGDVFIVTNKVQVDGMKEVLGGRISDDHILKEPVARNTSACIGYAAMEIVKKYGDGIMCIFPSDHYIKNQAAFTEILNSAVDVAEKTDKLITLGITPSFPSTGYGYIKYDKDAEGLAKPVVEFKEKPDEVTAKSYLESGDYAWNSGMFVWKASTILENFKTYIPDVYEKVQVIGEALGTDVEEKVIAETYPEIPSISIDYGIMEKSKDVVCISAEMGWNDVGSWDNLGVLYDADENGNVSAGETIIIDSKDCITYSKDRIIATVGLENIIVVETEDAILVCNKDRAQDVKKVVDTLKEKGKNEYL